MYTQFFRDHAFAHIKALEKDSSGSQRQLREFEHDAGLYDKIDAFRPAAALFCWRKPIYD